jgi:hypothetical protein
VRVEWDHSLDRAGESRAGAEQRRSVVGVVQDLELLLEGAAVRKRVLDGERLAPRFG